MLIYILVALFPLLVGFFFDTRVSVGLVEDESQMKKFRRKRWRWLLLAALPMFALIALRDVSMGADTGIYLKQFKLVSDTPWEKLLTANAAGPDFEPGFVIFEKLISYVTKNPQIYQIIYSTIYLISIVTFANNLEKYSFPFFFFFAALSTYSFMFTGVRQCLAMCICLWSYPFIKKRKFIPFLIILLLAFSFHKSAILFIVAYFIYNRKISWINTIIYAVVGVLSFIYIDVIQEWFNDSLDYDYEVESTGNGILFFVVILLVTAFSFFMILYYKKRTPESVGLLNIGVITFVFWFLRLVSRVAERPSLYFMFFTIGMLCYALEAPSKSRDRIIYKLIVYSLFFLFFVFRMSVKSGIPVPYVSFF